jgi:hypothetical protein
MGIYSRISLLKEEITQSNSQKKLADFEEDYIKFKKNDSKKRNVFIQREINQSLKEILSSLDTLSGSDIKTETYSAIRSILESAKSKGLSDKNISTLKEILARETASIVDNVKSVFSHFVGFGDSKEEERACAKEEEATDKELTTSDLFKLYNEGQKSNCTKSQGATGEDSIRSFTVEHQSGTYYCKGKFICKLPEGRSLKAIGGYRWELQKIISCKKQTPYIR